MCNQLAAGTLVLISLCLDTVISGRLFMPIHVLSGTLSGCQ